MTEKTLNEVRVRAYSPGKHPIIVIEVSPGQLRTVYYETDYDLDRTKSVEEDWLNDNALGRHSFVEVDPPRELPPSSLAGYVRQELLGES